ncbi:hypothetical protein H477_0549 [[Clostridium] sordellii ATCC 9714]|nr:hypothetical protein H477_0549 [[Clostridium] sordellii ATCC 9714] [Paeniclostridium sordellii ATCC 9714]
MCSSTFNMLLRIGTKSVPPPEPKIPFIKPVINPIKEFFVLK